jgi:hypothetical protein
MAKVVYSKMAQAFYNALEECRTSGTNPRHLGAVLLTHKAKGTGVIWRERLTVKKKEEVKAETAEKKKEGVPA